jgi:hypothetical protein
LEMRLCAFADLPIFATQSENTPWLQLSRTLLLKTPLQSACGAG